MLVQPFPKWSVNRAANIDHGVVIVEDVNPFLSAEIYWLGKGLLLAIHFWLVAPHHQITLPVHAKRVND